MILSLFRKDPIKDAADALYAAAAEQARLPVFFTAYGVEDTVEGRFEMMALHAYLILRRLRDSGDAGARLARAFTETFFAELDAALREMGVGDLSVGRMIRGLAEAFYGRIAAYENALAGKEDEDALPRALARNVFAAESAAGARPLAAYLRACIERLDSQPDGRIALGIVAFADPQPEKTDR